MLRRTSDLLRPETAHIDSPLRYYAQPMQAEIYARVNREGSDKDGSLEVDIPGTLAGVWFRDDLPIGVSGGDSWLKANAFAPDVRRPSQPRISIGSAFTIEGLYGVQLDAPAFSDVTASQGAVGFRLDGMDSSSNHLIAGDPFQTW